TAQVWPLRVKTSAPVFEFHTFTIPSRLAVAIRDPSGLKDAASADLLCPRSTSNSPPSLASHTRTVVSFELPASGLSPPAATTSDPSGLKEAERTASVCPLRVRRSIPVRASHTFAVISLLPVTTRSPSELNDTELTSAACPLRVTRSAAVRAFHTIAVLSKCLVTRRSPSGLNETDLTPGMRPLSE